MLAPPTNPTAMRVTQGACGSRQIAWAWSGARNATAYNVVLYNPVSGAQIGSTRVHGTRYILGAALGATAALKVQSANAAGVAPNYYTPSDTGHLPPAATNPTAVTASTAGTAVTFAWTGARHAVAYDVIVYHYNGATPVTDTQARTTHTTLTVAGTGGVDYHVKIRTVGQCGPVDTYVMPSAHATV